MAVELKEPALRLMTFIENNRQPEIAERFIADLVSRPLATSPPTRTWPSR